MDLVLDQEVSRFLVYLLIDPRNGEIRYIGKSTRGLYRPLSHSRRGQLSRDKSHRGNWIRQLKAAGLEPKIFFFEYETEEVLSSVERNLIAAARADGYKLTNKTDGGDGVAGHVHTDEERRKISQKLKGKPKTEEHRLRLRRPRTEEQKTRISEALRNLPVETRARITNGQLRAIEKISEVQKRRRQRETKDRLRRRASDRPILTQNMLTWMEAADYLGIGYSSLRRLIEQGLLVQDWTGRRHRPWSKHVLDRFLDEL